MFSWKMSHFISAVWHSAHDNMLTTKTVDGYRQIHVKLNICQCTCILTLGIAAYR
jgi:hypothetical protein